MPPSAGAAWRPSDAAQAPITWAELSDGLVCSECWSAVDRDQIRERIVQAVTSAVDSSGQRGIDPSPGETALILGVMNYGIEAPPPPGIVGSAAGSVDDRTSHQPLVADAPRSDTTDVDPPRAARRVLVTGAALTGRPLQVGIHEYRSVAARLRGALGTTGGPGWAQDTSEPVSGTYASGGGFTDVLPLVIASRRGAGFTRRAADLLTARAAQRADDDTSEARGWPITVEDARVDLYDLGVAVLTLSVVIDVTAEVALERFAEQVKRLVWLRPDPVTHTVTPLVAVAAELTAETVVQFQNAVDATAPDIARPPWLEPYLAPASSTATSNRASGRVGNVPASPDWGRLLWLHPVHHLTTDNARPRADNPDDPAAHDIAPTFHAVVGFPHGRLITGVGWSALITNTAETSITMVLDLIRLQWAYIAVYLEIDRGLLAAMDRDHDERAKTLTQLEDDADRVFDDYMRVMEARARIDSTLAGLGGDEQAVWDAINSVQKFDALVAGVDRKVGLLQRLADRRAQLAAATNSRRTTTILSFLTALTVVTVAVALLGNFIGSRSDALGHTFERAAIVIAALLVAIAIYVEAHRQRPRRPGGRPPPRNGRRRRHPRP